MQHSKQNQNVQQIECFCQKTLNFKIGTLELIKHFMRCNTFLKESPLAKEFSEIPLNELTLEPLIILRCELLGYLLQTEAEIKRKEGNLDYAIEDILLGKTGIKNNAQSSTSPKPQGNQQQKPEQVENQSKGKENKRMQEDTLQNQSNQKDLKRSDEAEAQIKFSKGKGNNGMEEETYPKKQLKRYQNEEDEEEEYNNKKVTHKLSHLNNSQPEDIDLITMYSKELTTCSGCNNKFDSNLDYDKFWFLSNCCDIFCKRCLNNQINEEFISKKANLKCKKCSSAFEREDFISILGKDKYDKLDNQLMELLCNIVICVKCNQKYDFSRGDENSSVLGKDGKQLNPKQLQHYSENRFVCQNSACKTEQCKSCKTTPYHLGQDCNEYKSFQESKRCRYCDTQIEESKMRKEKAFKDICQEKECSQKIKLACKQILECGHPCCGCKDELKCPPCLFEECATKNPLLKGVTGREFCNICFVEELQNAPIIQPKCGHIFHHECLRKKLEVKWISPRIVFNFCLCPLCKGWLDLPPDSSIYDLVEESRKLFMTIKDKSLKRLEHEERLKDEKLTKKESSYYNKPVEYAMAIYSYYMCHKCKEPYFGGLKDCERALDDDKKEFKPSDLICPNCCEIPMQKCKKHGDDFMEFKCRYCCSIAVWFCFGTTHFCEPCHNKVSQLQKMTKNQLPRCKAKNGCPFQGEHNPNGEETPLGCSICRNIKQSASEF